MVPSPCPDRPGVRRETSRMRVGTERCRILRSSGRKRTRQHLGWVSRCCAAWRGGSGLLCWSNRDPAASSKSRRCSYDSNQRRPQLKGCTYGCNGWNNPVQWGIGKRWPAREGQGQEDQQTGRGAAIGDHVQNGIKAGRLVKGMGIEAIDGVKQAGDTIEQGTGTRVGVYGHVVERGDGKDHSAVTYNEKQGRVAEFTLQDLKP